MAKYYLDIDLRGNLAKGLAVAKQSMHDMVGVAEQLSDALDDLRKLESAEAIGHLRQNVDGVKASLTGLRDEINATVFGVGQALIADAAIFQNAEADMKFAFKDQWEGTFEKVKKEAADLSFTFSETLSLATSLGRMDINPFGTMNKDMNIFVGRTGAMVSAFQILQDTADAVGKTADDVVISVRNALGGQWTSLMTRFDIPKSKIDEWRNSIGKLTDKQEQYNALVGELGKMFGGAGELKTGSWDKTFAQIEDVVQQIRAAIGGPGLKILTKAIQDFVDSLNAVLKNENAIKSFQDTFSLLAVVVGKVITGFGKLIEMGAELSAKFPLLPKLILAGVLAFSALLTAIIPVLGAISTLLGLAGAMITWKVVVGALATAFGGLWAALTPILIPLAPLILLVAGAVIGLVAALAALAVYKPPGQVVSFFEKVQALFRGVSELVGNLADDTSYMSVETMEALERTGMYDWAVTVYAAIRNLIGLWEGFSTRMEDFGSKVGPSAAVAFEEIWIAIREFLDLMGISDAAMGVSEDTMGSWADTGRGLADVVISLSKGFIFVTRTVTLMVSALLRLLNIAKELQLVLWDLSTGDMGGAMKHITKLGELFTKPLLGKEDGDISQTELTMQRMGAKTLLSDARGEQEFQKYVYGLDDKVRAGMTDEDLVKGFEQSILGQGMATEWMLENFESARQQKMGGKPKKDLIVDGIPLEDLLGSTADPLSRETAADTDMRTNPELLAAVAKLGEGVGALKNQPIQVVIDGKVIAEVLRDGRGAGEGGLD